MHKSGPSNNQASTCTSVSICHKIMKCLYCPEFGQLIISKIVRTITTRGQILGVKCTKFYHLGSLQHSSAGGAYSAPLTPWLHLRGHTYKGNGGRGGKRRRKVGSKKRVCPPIFTTDRRLWAMCFSQLSLTSDQSV